MAATNAFELEVAPLLAMLHSGSHDHHGPGPGDASERGDRAFFFACERECVVLKTTFPITRFTRSYPHLVSTLAEFGDSATIRSTMSRESESTGRRVLKFTLIVLLLPIIFPLAILGLILHKLNEACVYLLVWMWWLPRGKDVLYISSDSPIWKEYMEAEIFPLVAKRAVVLSWSARSKWPNWSFAVRVFHTFGGRRDFNPMIVLFRPFRGQGFFASCPHFSNGNTATTQASNSYAAT